MTMPPAPVREAVEATWRRRIAGAAPVGGGCISPTARVWSDAGDVAFLKWGEPGRTPDGLFRAEADGLAALAGAGEVRVPTVLGTGDEGAGWLLLKWLEPGAAGAVGWEALGRGLAALHRHRVARYGGPRDNFIGSLPQANGWMEEWAEFWHVRRLEPQLRRAREAGAFSPADVRRFDRLLDALPDRLAAAAAADGASLLHGDLWNGNVHFTDAGEPALIDPSSYHGHREVDLAMSELFGGFAPTFLAAYREAWPLEPGYARLRRPVYQLYYLLVHVNLFGGGYVGSTLSTLAEAGF